MAYNNYFPATYPISPYQQPNYQTQGITPLQQQNPSNGIVWVQGVEGAKAHPVAPNGSVTLMDSEESVFYIKSADASGMPSLRIFDYKERTQNQSQDAPIQNMDKYVTKNEFEKRLSEIVAKKTKKKEKEDE